MQRPNSILVSAALGILWACSGRDSTGPKAGPVASVELSPATATLSSLGATQSLSVVVKDSRGNSLSGKTVVWTSSAPGVAKVDAAGVVTAVINGSAIITAAVDGITGQATVTVEQQVAQLRTRRLSLGSQGNTRAGEPFDVSVEALDAGGNRVTTFAAPVTLALGANPGNATLGGTTTRTAAGGLASFQGVSIAKAGTGYYLTGSSGTMTAPAHGPFDIDPGPLSRLVFLGQPAGTVEANRVLVPQVRVEQRDAFDNVVTTAGSVTLTLGSAPWQGTRLLGTVTRTAVAGVASFDDLRVDRPGSGYRLVATSGTVTSQSSAFAIAVSFSTVSSGGENSSGSGFSCGTAPGGTFCWGANEYGQLGSPRAGLVEPVPFLVDASVAFVSVTTGYAHACGLTSSGEVWCWGEGAHGELGDGQNVSSRVPVHVNSSGPAGGRVYTAIDAGHTHTCGLVASALYCWGSNDYGATGNGANGGIQSVPAKIAGTGVAPLDFVQVSAGARFACGVTSAHAAWCWGAAFGGALGDGQDDTHRLSPVQVTGSGVAPLLFATISTGLGRTCAVTTGLPLERVYCWGSNSGGYLGTGGPPVSVLTPAQVPSPIGVSYRQVSLGYNTGCALDTANGAWCWGRGVSGEIGDGGLSNFDSPTWVTTPSGGFAQISFGGVHGCALQATGGGVYCWGEGPLGDGTMNMRSVPTRIVQ
ncbi:MAG: hypothetical protein MNPFHGCM_02216 [Gemmatimonadaceae bacterium]|nr:hypothetical protein [Gemmatimonadaceae bacterium]